MVDVHYADVVEVANRVAVTSRRSEKVAMLAGLLRRVAPAQAPLVVALLVGRPRQGRIGVGWATLQGVRVEPAAQASVTVDEVDRVVDTLARTACGGSQRERDSVLRDLMERLTAAEQLHLVRLFTGEMRQGASEAVVGDAVAAAVGVPAAALRRATMLLGDLGADAARALAGE